MEYPDHVRAYLGEQVALRAVEGPFDTNPLADRQKVTL